MKGVSRSIGQDAVLVVISDPNLIFRMVWVLNFDKMRFCKGENGNEKCFLLKQE